MKKNSKPTILILALLLLPLISFEQTTADSIEKELSGKWIAKETLLNGKESPNFNAKLQDYLLLKEDMSFVITDKQNEYEQTGTWKLIDNKFFELKDSGTRETIEFEIILLKDHDLKVKALVDEGTIEITFSK